MDSILTLTKKHLGIEEEYEHFDTEIVDFINGALMSLMQLGLGSSEGFAISDKTATWTDFVGIRKDLETVKSYVYLKVRLLFDPPASSFLVDAIKNQMTEMEWRLNVQVEGGTQNG